MTLSKKPFRLNRPGRDAGEITRKIAYGARGRKTYGTAYFPP
mgnify:CR=1 FL=1